MSRSVRLYYLAIFGGVAVVALLAIGAWGIMNNGKLASQILDLQGNIVDLEEQNRDLGAKIERSLVEHKKVDAERAANVAAAVQAVERVTAGQHQELVDQLRRLECGP